MSYFLRLSLLLAIALCVGEARAAAIGTDGTWYTFQFGATGSFGSDATIWSGSSLDPGGPAPWTFNGAGEFSVVDCCLIGDVFEVFDAGISLGVSFTPTATVSTCDDLDPDCILAEGVYSSRTYALGAGPHSITIRMADSPYGAGGGFFRAIAPEPTPLALLAAALAISAARRNRLLGRRA